MSDNFEQNADDLDNFDVGDDLNNELSDNQDENQDPSQEIDLGFSFDEPANSVDDELARLKAENEALKAEKAKWQAEPSVIELRARPTMFDHDYDEDRYEADLEVWLNEKAEHDKALAEQSSKYQDINQRYVDSVQKFSKIAVDYHEVESRVASVLSHEKQALLKMAVGDVAPFAYFLGKSGQTLDKLSNLDEVSFIKEVALLEYQMNNRPKSSKSKPMPKDHELTGSASGGFDKKLAELEAKAERTGDRTEVLAYKRALKAKSRI